MALWIIYLCAERISNIMTKEEKERIAYFEQRVKEAYGQLLSAQVQLEKARDTLNFGIREFATFILKK